MGEVNVRTAYCIRPITARLELRAMAEVDTAQATKYGVSVEEEVDPLSVFFRAEVVSRAISHTQVAVAVEVVATINIIHIVALKSLHMAAPVVG